MYSTMCGFLNNRYVCTVKQYRIRLSVSYVYTSELGSNELAELGTGND